MLYMRVIRLTVAAKTVCLPGKEQIDGLRSEVHMAYRLHMNTNELLL